MRSFHRLLLVFIRLRRRGALVEGEEDIRTERVLYLDRALGGEAVERAVVVRGERDTLIIDNRKLAVLTRDLFVIDGNLVLLFRHFADCVCRCFEFRYLLAKGRTEREHLETARVGHGWALPAHERAETARFLHDLLARRKIQVIRVREHDLGTERRERIRQDAFHVCLCPDRYKGGRVDNAMRRGE